MSSIVVANWDLDGQASASMLIRSGHADTVFFPEVGYYWLEDIWIESLSQYKYIYIVDMHIPRKDIQKLNTTSYVTIFDDSEIHPDYSGLKVTCVCGRRFSTTYILMDYLGIEPDVDAILGMYNDVGDNILTSEYWDIFSKYLEGVGMDVEELASLKNYYNAPYYVNKVSLLYRNVRLLMDRMYEIERLPSYEDMMAIIRDKDRYVLDIADKAVEHGKYVYLEYEGRMYVLTDLAKEISNRYPGRDIVIVDKGFIPGYYSIAVKSRHSLEYLVKMFIDLGLPAGGEGCFLGVVVKEEGYENIYGDIINYIGVE